MLCWSCAKSKILLPLCRKVSACHIVGTPLRCALYYIPPIQRLSKKTHVSQQYNIYFMTQYFSSTSNTLWRNNRTTCLWRFIFIFKRHESRIIQNFPPQQATRWPPSSSLHSRGSDRMCHNSDTTNVTNPTLAVQHFHNSNTFMLFFYVHTVHID
jgi:hypothetical protein